MIYVIENDFDLDSFEFWGGAVDVVEDLKERGLEDALVEQIEMLGEAYDKVTDTMINDFVWFEVRDLIESYPEYDEDDEDEE